MTLVAVSNNIINYVCIGTGQGTPILILHGWGRNLNDWTAMASELSLWSNRKVYVVDLPGFGGSSLPRVESIFEYSRLIGDFCKYLNLEKVILIGHSLGGRIGIVLAADYPTLVEKMILVDPAGVKPKSLKRQLWWVVAKIFGWVPASITNKIVIRMMDEDYRNSPPLRLLYKAVVKDDLHKYLRLIKCKTWVIWGEKDKILPLSLIQVYKKLLPYPIPRVIWEAGHDPHITHYTELKRVLEEAI